MPQSDLYHAQVRNALIKDGWTITDDPFVLELEGMHVYADLGAEKAIAAQKRERKIVVEIKSFVSPSLVSELEKAIGQYAIYTTFLKRSSPLRELFLAIAQDVYQDFFQRRAVQEIIEDHSIRLLVFEPDKEEVLEWIG